MGLKLNMKSREGKTIKVKIRPIMGLKCGKPIEVLKILPPLKSDL